MIFVDYRRGSQELIEPLRAMGLPVDETTLQFGDLSFEGRGLKGAAVSIGIEFKKIDELVQALRTERLQGYQMIGMRPMFDHSYLLIEGTPHYDAQGRLLKRTRFSTKVMAGRMTIGEFLKRKHVLHVCGGLNPVITASRKDTLQEIAALYRVWTDCDQDQHKSHLGIYVAGGILPVSEMRRTLSTFPGIGRKASLAVEQHFAGNLAKAVSASVDEWAGILLPGEDGKVRRLGLRTAERIQEFIHGR